ncbi:type II secretion system protein GspD, partial [bacterium]
GGGGGQGGGGLQGGGNASLIGGQGLVPAGIKFVSYDPTTNSLLVYGPEEDIATLQGYITQLDRAPRQVQIKVEFISVGEDLTKELGYEFLYQRGAVFAGTTPGSFAPSGNPVFLNYATGNVAGRLRAQLTTNNSRVEQSPIVRTLNNQPAVVSQFQTRYIFITSAAAVNGGAVLQGVTPVEVFAGVTLAVTPRINADDTVTVLLAPQVNGFQGTSAGPDGLELPNRFSQSISVVARVRNGETIVLGGFTSKNDNENIQKVPVLGDLPIIGQFFQSRSRQKVTTELLIFVTPTVIADDQTAPLGGP